MWHIEVKDSYGLIDNAVVCKASDNLYWVNITTSEKGLRTSYWHDDVERRSIVRFLLEDGSGDNTGCNYADVEIYHDGALSGYVIGEVSLEYGAEFVLFRPFLPCPLNLLASYEKPNEHQ